MPLFHVDGTSDAFVAPARGARIVMTRTPGRRRRRRRHRGARRPPGRGAEGLRRTLPRRPHRPRGPAGSCARPPRVVHMSDDRRRPVGAPSQPDRQDRREGPPATVPGDVAPVSY
ncbi:hypothetical protein Ae406Ps2_4939c [Pseudonocardia sp. Ae406_Ps2]|nr:hypothetical protein Ae331Ps2_1016 [Pseudonocardia sp. Ae331_Ps2]OLM04939.1 hypothetical protein Ae406Ps2_4939c [Pseudonocardia sp. Ae406_Ps2]OLM10229.1 hypothetical protein Ae505Ps2_0351 [Pseudonocardia sp. Ae505_Ps2]OLM26511.1 hypothetical protein Ae706Ps2_4944c [Pseudonocardia sp. Ae706_Ps2]